MIYALLFVLGLLGASLAEGSIQPNPQDLVDIANINPNIRLDIRYATTNNFTGKVVYLSSRCYLRRGTAEKLNKVQQELQELGLGLKIFDGYRPLSVQEKFWEICPDPRYVADPAEGSKHNRGSAVDVTLIELATGNELSMPSGFDEFTEKAHRAYASMLPPAGRNCKLLELIMVKHGFIPLPTEWWHFDDEDWQSYELLDKTFDQLEQEEQSQLKSEL